MHLKLMCFVVTVSFADPLCQIPPILLAYNLYKIPKHSASTAYITDIDAQTRICPICLKYKEGINQSYKLVDFA